MNLHIRYAIYYEKNGTVSMTTQHSVCQLKVICGTKYPYYMYTKYM